MDEDEYYEPLGDHYARISSALIKLNYDGQQKAIERVEELTEIPRYRRQEAAGAPPAPSEDRDTPATQDAPERRQEGE